jgi:hypothetical protein
VRSSRVFDLRVDRRDGRSIRWHLPALLVLVTGAGVTGLVERIAFGKLTDRVGLLVADRLRRLGLLERIALVGLLNAGFGRSIALVE